MELTSAFVFPVENRRMTYEVNLTITLPAESQTEALTSVVSTVSECLIGNT